MLLIRRYGTGFLCMNHGEKVLVMKCARWAAVRVRVRGEGEGAQLDWIGIVASEAGAAPRRERNVSPAGEFSAPHNVASASQGKPRPANPSSVGPVSSFTSSRHGQNRPTGPT